MTEREQLAYQDVRAFCYRREGGFCATCGAPLREFQLAHIIPQRKHWIRRYGKALIHHPENMRATCPTDLCNGAQSLGNNAYLIERHAAKITAMMAEEDVYV